MFHDTRHSAVTNLIGSGVAESIAMTITGHADRSVFTRYNVRRDDIQAAALARQQDYLAAKRGTTPTQAALLPNEAIHGSATSRQGTTARHDRSGAR